MSSHGTSSMNRPGYSSVVGHNLPARTDSETRSTISQRSDLHRPRAPPPPPPPAREYRRVFDKIGGNWYNIEIGPEEKSGEVAAPGMPPGAVYRHLSPTRKRSIDSASKDDRSRTKRPLDQTRDSAAHDTWVKRPRPEGIEGRDSRTPSSRTSSGRREDLSRSTTGHARPTPSRGASVNRVTNGDPVKRLLDVLNDSEPDPKSVPTDKSIKKSTSTGNQLPFIEEGSESESARSDSPLFEPEEKQTAPKPDRRSTTIDEIGDRAAAHPDRGFASLAQASQQPPGSRPLVSDSSSGSASKVIPDSLRRDRSQWMNPAAREAHVAAGATRSITGRATASGFEFDKAPPERRDISKRSTGDAYPKSIRWHAENENKKKKTISSASSSGSESCHEDSEEEEEEEREGKEADGMLFFSHRARVASNQGPADRSAPASDHQRGGTGGRSQSHAHSRSNKASPSSRSEKANEIMGLAARKGSNARAIADRLNRELSLTGDDRFRPKAVQQKVRELTGKEIILRPERKRKPRDNTAAVTDGKKKERAAVAGTYHGVSNTAPTGGDALTQRPTVGGKRPIEGEGMEYLSALLGGQGDDVDDSEQEDELRFDQKYQPYVLESSEQKLVRRNVHQYHICIAIVAKKGLLADCNPEDVDEALDRAEVRVEREVDRRAAKKKVIDLTFERAGAAMVAGDSPEFSSFWKLVDDLPVWRLENDAFIVRSRIEVSEEAHSSIEVPRQACWTGGKMWILKETIKLKWVGVDHAPSAEQSAEDAYDGRQWSQAEQVAREARREESREVPSSEVGIPKDDKDGKDGADGPRASIVVRKKTLGLFTTLEEANTFAKERILNDLVLPFPDRSLATNLDRLTYWRAQKQSLLGDSFKAAMEGQYPLSETRWTKATPGDFPQGLIPSDSEVAGFGKVWKIKVVERGFNGPVN